MLQQDGQYRQPEDKQISGQYVQVQSGDVVNVTHIPPHSVGEV
jgi:hypothetical protein